MTITKHLVLGTAALLAAAGAAPALAAPVYLDISGTAGDAGAFTGSLNLDVTGGIATSGSGTISIAGLTNAPLVLITTTTPGNETGGGPSAPVGFRANDGTDLFGADQAYPFSANGLLFDVGTSVASFGNFPLLNLYNDRGYGSLFTGSVNGVEHYVQFGSLTVSPGTAPGAVPEIGTWAMMMLGAGLVGAALRRRQDRVTTRVAFA